MDTEFLVEIKQSNECGSLTNDEILDLHLSHHPLPPARQQPHLLISSTQTITQKKAKNQEMRFHSQNLVWYHLCLCTQNPGLRQVDLELSPKRGSDKLNILD